MALAGSRCHQAVATSQLDLPPGPSLSGQGRTCLGPLQKTLGKTGLLAKRSSSSKLMKKPSIQARKRKHQTLAPGSNKVMLVESEYERKGSWAYMAGWDVHRAKVFGRCELRSGIASYDRLVDQVMVQEPYCSAERVFWIVDNGSSHRGEKACSRLSKRWPAIELVHLPVHASWLNQIEIYFSVVQRKVLTPCSFKSLYDLEDRLLSFQEHYQAIVTPFEWKFTRADLHQMLEKLNGLDLKIAEKELVCA